MTKPDTILRGCYLGKETDTVKNAKESKLFNFYEAKGVEDLLKDLHLDFVLIDFENGKIVPELDKINISKLKPIVIAYNATDIKLLKELGIADNVVNNADDEALFSRVAFLSDFRYNNSLEKIIERKFIKYKIPVSKRLFDIVFSIFALLFLMPLFLVVVIAMKIESRGPIFYNGKRVGAGYRIFPFHKFRSMFVGADARIKDMKHLNQYATDFETEIKMLEEEECPDCKAKGSPCSPILFVDGKQICENKQKRIKEAKAKGTFVKIANDPRVTKVGKFIRKTSIDELPQLFNVLKGDMSIVGNRPIPLYEAEMLTSDAWTERFLAPAGITGLWQVTKRGKEDMSEEERKELDNEYARNYNFLYDIKLLFKTIKALKQTEDV